MAEKVTIKGIKMSDETELTFPGLENISFNSSGNLEISTPTGSKLNFVPQDNIQMKPNDKIQLCTENYTDTDKQDEFKISVIKDKKTKVEGLKMEVAGLKFESASADTASDWTKGLFPIMFKQESGEVDTWSKVNMHGGSFDIRTRTTGAGTGGGIALQIASCDSDYKENKLKVETSRIKDVFDGLPTSQTYDQYYVGEGGKGIEIGTLNSQFESLYTAEMRRGAETKVFAVTRGTIEESGGKKDYPTQNDDSKDIKPSGVEEIVWRDIVNAAIYLKLAGKIPSDTDTAATFSPEEGAGQASDYVYKAQQPAT